MNGEDRIRTAVGKVLELIEKEELELVTLAVFRLSRKKPSDSWSFLNRLIMFANGTEDARGYRQWEKVGRHVKRGAKAFHILVPIFKKVPVKRKEVEAEIEATKAKCVGCSGSCDGCEVAERVKTLEKELYFHVNKLVGFKTAPVFRKEDTEGAPLEEDELQRQLQIPCEFSSIIRELGLTVRAKDFDGEVYGYYAPRRKEVVLASPEVHVFLHELCHAVDDKLHGLAQSEEENEVVAELSAAVVGYLLGYKVNLKFSKVYLARFNPATIYKVMQRVERVVGYIVERTTSFAQASQVVT